jgi:hypothetical protein
MKVDWEKLRKQIPSEVHLKRGVHYEVLWVESLKDCVGEMRPGTKQIVLELGHTDKQTVHTYFHELAHAISEEYGLNLTETQVLKFEESVYYLLKSDNLLKGKK